MSADFSNLPYRTIRRDGVNVSPYRDKVNIRGGRVSVTEDRTLGRIDVVSSLDGPRALLHEVTPYTVGLWQFQETLNDASGNGFHLDLDSGNERYVEVSPGMRALKLFANSKYNHPVTDTALKIPGNVTILMIVLCDIYNIGGSFFNYVEDGETEAVNSQYGVAYDPTVGDNLLWFSESGAGVNAAFQFARNPPLFQLCHLAFRRSANVASMHANGLQIGSSSGVLATPTGGQDAILWLGYDTPTAPMCIASWRIDARALSDDEITEEYNRTLGGVYGERL